MKSATPPGQPPVATKLAYDEYLRVTDLLRLQQPLSTPAHHDEYLFIIIHQTYELWFKLILHELDNAQRYMDSKEVLRAHHFMRRVVEIQKLLVSQIHILETMTPVEFLEFRDRLDPASGFQSAQFREIEFVAGLKDERYLPHYAARPDVVERLKKRLAEPDLRTSFYEMLRALGFAMPENAAALEAAADAAAKPHILNALLPIYQHPDEHLALYLLSESLVELDEWLALWREHHVRVVERVIGFKRGTGGSSGVSYLRTTTSKKCFPYLWEVRTFLEKGSALPDPEIDDEPTKP